MMNILVNHLQLNLVYMYMMMIVMMEQVTKKAMKVSLVMKKAIKTTVMRKLICQEAEGLDTEPPGMKEPSGEVYGDSCKMAQPKRRIVTSGMSRQTSLFAYCLPRLEGQLPMT